MLPDEPAWSGCARLKQRFPRLKDSYITELVSSEPPLSFVNIALPRHGKDLARIFGYGDRWRIFLRQHTFWPWILPFTYKTGVRRYMAHFLGTSAKIRGLLTHFGEPKLLIDVPFIASSLRVCPQCVFEDDRKYGTVYWHRRHQFAGLRICPRHKCELSETSVRSPHIVPSYTALSWTLIEAATPLPKPDSLQLSLARNIDIVARINSPLEGRIIPRSTKDEANRHLVSERIRHLVLQGGFPCGCRGNEQPLLEYIERRLGHPASAAVIECGHWSEILERPFYFRSMDLQDRKGPPPIRSFFGRDRIESPLPMQLLVACYLFGVLPTTVLAKVFSERMPDKESRSCIDLDGSTQRHRVEACQRLTRRSFPLGIRLCESCISQLRRKNPQFCRVFLAQSRRQRSP